MLVQRFIEKKEQIDWKRNAIFWVFGGVYLGGVQWFIYVTLFKRLWPGMTTFAAQGWTEKLRNVQGLRDLGKQVAFDNFVHYPFIYFPVFYVFKQSIQGDVADLDAGAVLCSAMSKYRQNAAEDNVKMWMLWVCALTLAALAMLPTLGTLTMLTTLVTLPTLIIIPMLTMLTTVVVLALRLTRCLATSSSTQRRCGPLQHLPTATRTMQPLRHHTSGCMHRIVCASSIDDQPGGRAAPS